MKKIWIISLIYLLLGACNDPYEGSTFLAYESSPISTYMNAHPETFSEWVKILNYTNMYNALNQSDAIFTAFAPDNNAVKAFYEKKGVTDIGQLGEAYARDLVSFHVVPAGIPAERFTEGIRLLAQTYSGDRLTIDFREGGKNAIYVNEEARVSEIADTVINGYIYVLDAVLTPLVETLMDRLEENNPRYSIFKDAVAATGWEKRLDTPYDTTLTNQGSLLTKKNFTLMAVPDEVFNSKGINNLVDLKNHLNVTGTDYTSKDNPLWQYVAYHIVNGSIYQEELYKFETNDTVKFIGTNEESSVIALTKTGGQFYLNYEGENVQFIDGHTDLLAKNGLIHDINGLLEVWTPEATVVNWDFCDYPDIAELVGYEYKQLISTEKKFPFNQESVTSYTWNANDTKTSTTTWPVLGYATEKSGSMSNGGNYNAMNHDMLSVNLGYLGSFETTTPILIRGKYKVEVFYGYGTSLKDFRANGSKCQFTFDDEISKEVLIYKGVENKVGIYSSVIAEMVEFETTTSHTFKLVLMDPAASTNTSYRLQLDYIKFTPIK